MRHSPPERFPPREHACLLAGQGIGETVIHRIEQAGISSLEALAACDVDSLCLQIAGMLGATCWRNSPQARRAVDQAIAIACRETGHDVPHTLP